MMDEWPLRLRVILAKACRPHLVSARCKPVSSPIENEKAERICIRLWGGLDRVPNWVNELSLVTSVDEPLESLADHVRHHLIWELAFRERRREWLAHGGDQAP